MGKQLHLIVDANVLFDFAEAVTRKLNEKYGTNYNVFEFYGDRFKSVLGDRQNQDILSMIETLTTDDIHVRNNIQVFMETLRVLTNEEKIDFQIGSYGDSFKEYPNMNEIDCIELEEPVIYVGSDYDLCMKYLAEIKVLFKNGLNHKKNRVLGNEDNFYIVDTFEDLTELVKFYAEHTELVE